MGMFAPEDLGEYQYAGYLVKMAVLVILLAIPVGFVAVAAFLFYTRPREKETDKSEA